MQLTSTNYYPFLHKYILFWRFGVEKYPVSKNIQRYYTPKRLISYLWSTCF